MNILKNRSLPVYILLVNKYNDRVTILYNNFVFRSQDYPFRTGTVQVYAETVPVETESVPDESWRVLD